ncbi:MAG TPA: hypothetical protein P5137_02140 [Candidatus Brocadiia bacterium]|nr:hypothetical protein [Candidatus Brocadiia bacterium]
MPDTENREKVLVLTSFHRIEGEMQTGPDGTLWDFKHRAADRFMTVYDAQFFRADSGLRDYDAAEVEVNKDHVVAVFRERDLAFMRKGGPA